MEGSRCDWRSDADGPLDVVDLQAAAGRVDGPAGTAHFLNGVLLDGQLLEMFGVIGVEMLVVDAARDAVRR